MEVDVVPEVDFRIDDRACFELLSANWLSLTGYSIDSMTHRSVVELFHEDDRETVEAALVELLCGHDAHEFSARMIVQGGATRRVELRARVIRDSSGHVLGAAGTLRDAGELQPP